MAVREQCDTDAALGCRRTRLAMMEGREPRALGPQDKVTSPGTVPTAHGHRSVRVEGVAAGIEKAADGSGGPRLPRLSRAPAHMHARFSRGCPGRLGRVMS